MEIVGKTEETGENLTHKILAFLVAKRARFIYGYRHLLDYMSRCVCFRNKAKMRKEESVKRHYLYEKGNEKLKRELDIVNLIKTLRQLRLMAQAMMPEKNRLLLKF
jgi:hypothetical protein